MATFRVQFTENSGINPQEQTVEADGVNVLDEEYRFYMLETGETVRIVRKDAVVQIERE